MSEPYKWQGVVSGLAFGGDAAFCAARVKFS